MISLAAGAYHPTYHQLHCIFSAVHTCACTGSCTDTLRNEEESQSRDSCATFWSDVETVAKIYSSSRLPYFRPDLLLAMELSASLKYLQNFTKSCFIYFSDVLFFTVLRSTLYICIYALASFMRFAQCLISHLCAKKKHIAYYRRWK